MTSKPCSQVLDCKFFVSRGKFPSRYFNFDFYHPTSYILDKVDSFFSLTAQCRPVYLGAPRNNAWWLQLSYCLICKDASSPCIMHQSQHHNLVIWRPIASNPSSLPKKLLGGNHKSKLVDNQNFSVIIQNFILLPPTHTQYKLAFIRIDRNGESLWLLMLAALPALGAMG